jgi:antitoxin ChpS
LQILLGEPILESQQEVAMQVKIQQWGNSVGIRLPATVLKQMGLVSGDLLSLDVSTEAMTLKPLNIRPRYRLADLVAQCDLTAPEPADLAAWKTMVPEGREI